jgi:hypothetical protein
MTTAVVEQGVEPLARHGLHVLGVRHHGPGSARSVVAALDELEPDAVLIESPFETTAALAWVGSVGLVPPVALLGHVVDEPHRAVFAPLAGFSPEWQAAAWANRRGVVVEAIRSTHWGRSLQPPVSPTPNGGGMT